MLNESQLHLLDQTYQCEHFSFRYPGYWDIEEQQTEDGLTVTVSTDEGSFWMLTAMKETVEPVEMLESAVAAFTEEYDQIDVYEREDHSEHGWSRQELEFECTDLIVTVILQAIQLPEFTLLLLIQGQDQEIENYRGTFDAMTATLIQRAK